MDRLTFTEHDDLRLFEKLHTPIWVFDVDRHAIWWANQRGIAFWKAADLPSLLARDFSTDSETTRQRLRQIVDTTLPDTSVRETWTLYPGGTPVQTVLSFEPVRLGKDGAGLLAEVHHIHSDLADADTLRMTEATRATAQAVSTFAMDGKLLAQNPASAACFGPRAPIAPNSASDLEIRFVDPTVALALLDQVRDKRNPTYEAMVRTNIGVRWHLVSARLGRDPVTGDDVAILSEEDITEQTLLRQRQQQDNQILEGAVAERTDRLRASEERFDMVMEIASIWDWDLETNRTFVSPSFIRALGYGEAEFKKILITEGMDGVVFPDDLVTFHAAMQHHIQFPGQPIIEELRFQMSNGDVRWYHAQGRLMCNAQGVPVRSIGLLTDITQRKELEASLMASQRLEAIGQLTGGIAHDFNNLLTVIQGNAQLMYEIGDAGPGRAEQELIEEIVKAVQRGAELTRHLLAFARQQTLNPQVVDLTELMQTMRNTILRALTEHIAVDFDLPDTLWPVYADPNQIEAALLNIAINARDAMPNGGRLALSCRNHWRVENSGSDGLELDPGAYLEIGFTDTGQGMLPETLAKAFEPFFTTKEVGRGSGLGLSMVLGFSRQSGGDTRIESSPETGTRVLMYLPRAQVQPSQPAPSARPALQRGNGEHIHVLEDNTSVQSALARMLISLGYQVSASTTVKAALQASATQPAPHLYLVDVILPGGRSGVDFARIIRSMQPGAPIVLMSGYPDSALSEADRDKLTDAFLAKPIDKGQLSQVMSTALSKIPQPG